MEGNNQSAAATPQMRVAAAILWTKRIKTVKRESVKRSEIRATSAGLGGTNSPLISCSGRVPGRVHIAWAKCPNTVASNVEILEPIKYFLSPAGQRKKKAHDEVDYTSFN